MELIVDTMSNWEGVEAILYPGTVEHFKHLDRLPTMSLALGTTFKEVLYSDPGEVSNIRIVRIERDERIVVSEFILEELPDLGYESIAEIEVKCHIGGEEVGFAFFASQLRGCYYVLVPDMTDLWSLEPPLEGSE